jgi:hypothetical protein
VRRVLLAGCLCATLAGAAEPPSRPLPAPQAGAWVIELGWQGGFTGHAGGYGAITSAGEGRFVRGANVPPPATAACRTTLAEAELAATRQALAASAPDRWRASYTPASDNGCCDRFRYRLTLARREPGGTVRTSATAWLDGNEGLFPRDLATLVGAARSALRTAEERCNQMRREREHKR